MNAVDALRLVCIVLAVINFALCVAYAIHMWTQGNDPVYRKVFHASVFAYAGIAVACAGMIWNHAVNLGNDGHYGLVLVALGQALLLAGMVQQLRYIGLRDW